MFVKKERIPIQDDKGNTIYIRARMDVGTEKKVHGSAITIRAGMTKEEIDAMPFDVGAWELALLQHNIIAWEGPGFTDERGRPILCNPAKVLELDPREPIVTMALEEIGKRNRPPEAPDPKSPTGSGFTSDGESDSTAD